jgi:hypothetical protein
MATVHVVAYLAPLHHWVTADIQLDDANMLDDPGVREAAFDQGLRMLVDAQPGIACPHCTAPLQLGAAKMLRSVHRLLTSVFAYVTLVCPAGGACGEYGAILVHDKWDVGRQALERQGIPLRGNMCVHCGVHDQAGREFYACARCGKARYCSAACELAHEPQHRVYCNTLAPAPETEESEDDGNR